jgi:hypothetical protein
MNPNQVKFLKNLIKILAFFIAFYLVFWHPLFVLMMIFFVVLLGALLIIYLPKIKDFFEDNDIFK